MDVVMNDPRFGESGTLTYGSHMISLLRRNRRKLLIALSCGCWLLTIGCDDTSQPGPTEERDASFNPRDAGDDATVAGDSGDSGDAATTSDAATMADASDASDRVPDAGGLDCSVPPPTRCVGESTLREYTGAGHAVDGRCVYDQFQDVTCTDCCYGAEINLTGEPIGGGGGYSDIMSPSQATVVVSTVNGLLSALVAAQNGDIIYVEDAAELDLTDQGVLDIPGGVILASGRGRDGSQGGLVFCDSFTDPLFRAVGDRVRITGLRLRGPQADILDHDYVLVPHSGAVATSHDGLEIDNNEIFAWGTHAISLKAGANGAHVHHNNIHHTRRAGLGYGVVLNQSDALIEGNLFDTCRHHIAGTGRYGTSYEARYNIVLEHANGHAFDMHGARDFDKRATKAIWRFDEGSGTQATDSSIGLYHNLNHCTLMGMDPSQAWVPGRINTGIEFDGVDDHLVCGDDSSLKTAQGTIYFWMKADSLGQTADFVTLFEDASTDYLSVSLDASDRIRLEVTDDNTPLIAIVSDGTIPDTDFHHVAVTQDGTSVRIFIDGQETPVTGTNGGAWSSHLTLAGSRVGMGFSGVLDEMRIYDRALEPGEVDLHHGGNPDIAGNSIAIHHNTFRGTEQRAVVIRGKPADGATIHHNWFHTTDPDRSVSQVNAEGNMVVEKNHFGAAPPLGTVLPLPRAVLTPAVGKAPLGVTFDGSGSTGDIVAHHWDFGDGSTGHGPSMSQTYVDVGHYLARLTVYDSVGVPESSFSPVRVAPVSGQYALDFWVKDSYVGQRADFYRKQALIDEQIVWEDDVAGDEGWEHVSVDIAGAVSGKSQIELTFRVQNVNAVTNAELIEVDVFWDDVALLGGTAVQNGDFETTSRWSYSENGSSWRGLVSASEPHSGDGAYKISYPYLVDCPAGAYAQVSQLVSLKSPDIVADWRLDDASGTTARDESLFYNHGALVNMAPSVSWAPGVKSYGLVFDGIDDRVEVVQPAGFSSTQGSVEFWMTDGNASGESVLLEVFEISEDDALSIRRTASGALRLQRREAGVPVLDVTSEAAVNDGLLHHILWTQDGTSARLYLDGAEVATTGTNGGQWTDGLTPTGVWIGAGHGSHFAGLLDEVIVHSRALDAAEAIAAHESGLLLGHWTFDDGQGTTASDLSTFRHDGTLMNMDAASAWTSGQLGGALFFDGQDDYVEYGADVSLTSGEGTIEFWLKTSLFDEVMDLVNIYQDGYQNYLLIRRDSNNRIYVRVEEADQGMVAVSSLKTIADDAFHHVAVTQDGFGVLIYIDGEEAGGSGTNSGYWTEHLALQGFWIGAGHWSNFSGVIDDVRVYPRALRPAEIAERATH
jgi:hypothetical protein